MKKLFLSVIALMFVAGVAQAGFIGFGSSAEYAYPTATGTVETHAITATAGTIVNIAADSDRKRGYIINRSTSDAHFAYSVITTTTAFAAADTGVIPGCNYTFGSTTSTTRTQYNTKDISGYTGAITLWGDGATLSIQVEEYSN